MVGIIIYNPMCLFGMINFQIGSTLICIHEFSAFFLFLSRQEPNPITYKIMRIIPYGKNIKSVFDMSIDKGQVISVILCKYTSMNAMAINIIAGIAYRT